ncbi:methionyl-tRNA formyltransferase [Paenibacillus thalictri]|uniref:Formyl transferase n=1 Tax=Paenibacillus thalictri TaxID=2527873 RepID=A0A4Q9DFL2_9BACL|nr:formyltransferase family protein [Paenibacillus thalictri]TBL70837.1 formyl transferase [Paenibacillus thalictri]
MPQKPQTEHERETSVILFGSLGVAVDCLEWLLGQPGLRVLGVVCTRAPKSVWRRTVSDRDMQDVAPTLGVPLLTMDDVLSMNADIGLSVRFHHILRASHLSRFRLGVVNLHGAPLPEMRGSMCDAMAIVEGRNHYGTTLHWMDCGIDTGDILAERRFPIGPDDTVFDLFEQSNRFGLELIQAHLLRIISGDLQGRPQQQLTDEQDLHCLTYTSKEVLKYKAIHPGLCQEQLWNRVRAFQFPGHEPAYFVTPSGKIYCSMSAHK